MGTWGPAIFSDDLASDVREGFRDLIGEGLDARAATECLRDDCADVVGDPEEGPVFLIALAASQWKRGHVDPPVIAEALAAIAAGGGMERWEDAAPGQQRARRRALDKLAGELATPPRDPIRIPRRRLQDTPLELGDVVAVPDGERTLLFAVIDFHVDKGGRATVVRRLPFLDDLPADRAEVREAALSGITADMLEITPFFIAFNDGRTPQRPPDDVAIVARGLFDAPLERMGGLVTWWS